MDHDELPLTSHSPVGNREAIEKRLKAIIWRIGCRNRHYVLRLAPCYRSTRKHRIGRADGGEKRRGSDVGVGNTVEAPIGVGDRRIGILPHPERACFVVRGAQTVTASTFLDWGIR